MKLFNLKYLCVLALVSLNLLAQQNVTCIVNEENFMINFTLSNELKSITKTLKVYDLETGSDISENFEIYNSTFSDSSYRAMLHLDQVYSSAEITQYSRESRIGEKNLSNMTIKLNKENGRANYKLANNVKPGAVDFIQILYSNYPARNDQIKNVYSYTDEFDCSIQKN